jgi:hypothetical protein
VIVWDERARADFDELIDRYGRVDLNLGSALGRAVDDVLWSIESSPAGWPVVEPEMGIRRAILMPRRFRTLLLFYLLVRPYPPVVIALIDGRRDPDFIAGILRGRIR